MCREPVQIESEPDHILITSFPGIDRSVPLSVIEKGERFKSKLYRNRRLGEFLKELDLTEGRGTGIPTIQEGLLKNGSPRATFETDEERRVLWVTIPIQQEFLQKVSGTMGNIIIFEGSDGGSTTPKLPPNDPKSSIIMLIEDNPHVTRKAIAEKLGITIDGARYHLKKLTDSGVIKYVGTSRKGYWELRKK